jgi:hypothetical protein
MDLIHNSLTPGKLYGALIQPRSEKGPVTMGPMVQLQTNTTEEWLRNHPFTPAAAYVCRSRENRGGPPPHLFN